MTASLLRGAMPDWTRTPSPALPIRTTIGAGGYSEKIGLLDTLARVPSTSLKRIIFGVARGRAKSAAYCAGSQPFQRLSRRDMAG